MIVLFIERFIFCINSKITDIERKNNGILVVIPYILQKMRQFYYNHKSNGNF